MRDRNYGAIGGSGFADATAGNTQAEVTAVKSDFAERVAAEMKANAESSRRRPKHMQMHESGMD